MKRAAFAAVVMLSALPPVPIRSQQKPAPPPVTVPPASDGPIYLDVSVEQKSGAPVTGLKQQDFTLLDNKTQKPIESFRAYGGGREPLEVLLVIDAVNVEYQTVAFERQQIDKFLKMEGGQLSHPTALAVLTDSGVQIQPGFSQDGNVISAALDQYVVGLRSIRRSAGFWGAADRYDLSLTGLEQIGKREASRPGRKIVIWLSPGWPLFAAQQNYLDKKEEEGYFSQIVNISTLLTRGRVTMYVVNPIGEVNAGTTGFYWEEFVKPVKKADSAQPPNLALEVISSQSGGLVMKFGNDVAGMLQECVADAGSYYELTFQPAKSSAPNEFHELQVKVNQPHAVVRTRQGYYAQP